MWSVSLLFTMALAGVLGWVWGVCSYFFLSSWVREKGYALRCSLCGKPLRWRAFLPFSGGQGGNFSCGHGVSHWKTALGLGHLGAALGLTWLYGGASWLFLFQAWLFFSVLVMLAAMDLLTQSLSLGPLFLLLALRLAFLLGFLPQLLVDSVGGMLMGAGLMTLVGLAYEEFRGRKGLGEGDAAMMGLIGAFVGWQGILPVAGISALLALALGLPWLLGSRLSPWHTPLPYAPFLALSGFGVYLAQRLLPPDQWLQWVHRLSLL